MDGLAPGLKSIRPGSFPEAPIGYIKNANENEKGGLLRSGSYCGTALHRWYLMVPASAQLRVSPERKDGGHPALCNAPPQWLRMRHQSHQKLCRSRGRRTASSSRVRYRLPPATVAGLYRDKVGWPPFFRSGQTLNCADAGTMRYRLCNTAPQ